MIVTDLQVVDAALKSAAEHGLEAEVVMFALMAMKRDPSLTIQEVILIGHDEWVK